ncbi:alpha/beta fold hydrolase [Azotobacter sp. CWF10]
MEATIDNVLTVKPLSAEGREQVIADSLRGATAAKRAWPTATSQEDITEQVGAIDMPALVIAGELDRVNPPKVLREQLLSRIPHATMHGNTWHGAFVDAGVSRCTDPPHRTLLQCIGERPA